MASYLHIPWAARCCSQMGWKLFLLMKATSISLWTLLVRYLSERNNQKLFYQHISTQDKSSPSYPQHSLAFSFFSGREYYSHQKAQPLLAHPSRFFPIMPPINLCVTSSESSGAWAALPPGPALASGHSPGSQAQPLPPRWIALLPTWPQSSYFLSSSCHPPRLVTDEWVCMVQGEKPFTVS